MSDLIKYSAVTVKTRAMYGKLLTVAQWESLRGAESLQGVWELLRRCPGWARVGEVSPERRPMEEALSAQIADDCKRLSLFLGTGDRKAFILFCRHQLAETPMTPEEYQRWWTSGLGRNRELRRVVGTEIDAMNLVYLLRLRRFPASAPKAKEYLIPIHYELKERMIDRLLQAPDDRTVLELLEKTRWGAVFQSLAPGELEKQYQHYMEQFCRRMLTSSTKGFEVVQAFLPLKDMERRKLLRLMGAVQGGVDPYIVV